MITVPSNYFIPVSLLVRVCCSLKETTFYDFSQLVHYIFFISKYEKKNRNYICFYDEIGPTELVYIFFLYFCQLQDISSMALAKCGIYLCFIQIRKLLLWKLHFASTSHFRFTFILIFNNIRSAN